MNYANIKWYDIANGIGMRVSLFVSGCRNHCTGCFNAETWDFSYGNAFTNEIKDKIIAHLKMDHINGITFLGGEPFEPENIPVLATMIADIKKECPLKNIWMFSGYTYEQLTKRAELEPAVAYVLNNIDVLVDGKFEQELYDVSLKFRGSANQRVIDVPATLKAHKIVLRLE